MKKVFLLILATVLFTASNYAQSDFVVENGVLTAYSGPGGDVVIPDDLGITSIGDMAFNTNCNHCDKITSIFVPGGVKNIGDYAFLGCPWINSIILAEGVETIGERVFCGYELEYVSIPSTVTQMADAAFSDIRLRKLDLHWSDPSEVPGISFSIFTNMNVFQATLTVPDGTKALYAATAPWTFFVETDSRRIVEENENASDFGITENGLLEYYWGLERNIKIPEAVASISSLAFRGCKIDTVTTEWTTPIHIDQNVFIDPSALALFVPAGTKAAYKAADVWKDFGAIIEKPVTHPDFVVDPNGVLTEYKGTGGDVVIPDNLGITAIGDGVFENNPDLTSIRIPDGVIDIGQGAFRMCHNLSSVEIPDGVKEIKSAAFLSCQSLQTVTIPDGVTSIGLSAFMDCQKLESVTIPNSVTSIGDCAFSICINLHSIAIPSSVTHIGIQVFANNFGLQEIEVAWNTPLSGVSLENFFFNYYGGHPALGLDTKLNALSLIVPVGTKTAYQNADFWKEFGVIVEKGEALPEFIIIDNKLTKYLGDSESVIIPDNVTSIEQLAFYGKTNLTSVVIPNGVTEIGARAFGDNRSLTSITIPDGVETLGYGAFERCSAISSVVIPNSVTTLNGATFAFCSSLSYVSIPNSIVYGISGDLFMECNALQTVEIAWDPIHMGVFTLFEYVDVSNTTLLVPDGTKDDYIAADVQQIFGTIKEKGEHLSDFVIDAQGVLIGYIGSGGHVVVPNTVKEIAAYTLSYKNITSLFIPASVEYIQIETTLSPEFCITDPVEKFIVDPANQYYSSENGVLYNKNKSILLKYPVESSNTAYTIPNTVDSVAFYAFSFGPSYSSPQNLEYLTIPCEINHLGIAHYLFSTHTKLKFIEITGTSKLSSVIFCDEAPGFGQMPTTIRDQILIVPVGMKEQYQALDNCNCAGRIIEKGDTISDFEVNSNGVLVKYYGSDTDIVIPDAVNGVTITKIGEYAFFECTNLVSVHIPTSVTEIGQFAFHSTAIDIIKIPASVQSIGISAFITYDPLGIEPYHLKRVETEWTTIPDDIEHAFSIESTGIIPDIAYAKLVIPFGTREMYNTIEPWKYFGTIEEKVGTEQLDVSATSLNIVANGGTGTVDITSNVTWKVVCDATWASVNIDSCYGNSTLTITAAANTASTSRTATFTITGRNIVKTVTVTQAAAVLANQLNISTSTVNFDKDGGNVEVDITSNVIWAISYSAASWIETNVSSGSGNAKIEIIAQPNTTTASRSEIVTITGGGITKTITVTQDEREDNSGENGNGNGNENGNENGNGDENGNENEDEEIIATPSTPVGNTGSIELSLNIPSDKSMTGEFTVTMPDGFNLDKGKTVLAQELQGKHSLDISDKAKGQWVLKISPTTNARSSSNNTYRKIVDIAYTVDEGTAKGNYDIQISGLDFTMSDNTTIKEDNIEVNVTHDSSVGNEQAEQAVKVNYYNNTLSIHSPVNERIEIFTTNGILIFSKQKPEGAVIYHTNDIPKGVIIVRGSSGWVKKMIIKK